MYKRDNGVGVIRKKKENWCNSISKSNKLIGIKQINPFMHISSKNILFV